MQLFEITWKHADNPDEDQSVTVIKRHVARYMKTTCPLAKLIRQLLPGDSIKLVDGNGLRTITARCFDTSEK